MNVRKVIVVGVSLVAFVFAADPWAGNWEMRPTSEKDLASRTTTETETGPYTFHVTFDHVSKAGKKRHSEETLVRDGKEHPNNRALQLTICTRTGPTMRTLAAKKAGKSLTKSPILYRRMKKC
jgi:hypothetical protein